MSILERIRSGSDSTGMQIVLGLVLVSFVGWGFGVQGDRTATVATVNGDRINGIEFARAYDLAERQMQQGRTEPMTQDEREALREQVLQQLVRQRALVQEASAVGLEVSDAEVADAMAWIDRAAVLGAPHIRFFAGTGKQLSEDPARLVEATDALNRCAEHAAAKGIFLGVENHGNLTSEQMLAIMQRTDNPWVGINLDTGNFLSEDPYRDLEICAPYAVNVQVKVSIKMPDGKHYPADFDRIAQILKDANYQGFVILEYEDDSPYDKIPEDAPIPVAPSSKRTFDTAIDRVRQVMTAAGLSEAMTPSVVTKKLDESLSPWTDRPALQTQTPMLKGAKRLRRTLLPSLIEGRAANWASSSIAADIFEIAHIYLPGESGDTLPHEQYTLGIVSGRDFFELKGVLETLVERLGIDHRLTVAVADRDGFASGGGVELKLSDRSVGYLGIVDPKTLKGWKLPPPVVVAEVDITTLLELADLVPKQRAISQFPSIQRDLNFVVAEKIRWSEMENVVRAAIGSELAGVTYRETYRDEKKDGKDRKRVLMTVELQRHDATLSGQEAEELVSQVIGACEKQLKAQLLS